MRLSIVIPNDATDREQFAANELQTYLCKIFGSTFPICVADKATTSFKILIGCPRRNTLTSDYISVETFDALVPGPEGFLIQSFEDAIVLAGSSTYPNDLERGTIYAVYEFLERFLGCSLSAYTKQDVAGGEYVPTLECIDLSDIFYAKAKADLPYRAACVQNSSHGKGREIKLIYAFLDWLCKNRYNYFYTWNSVYEEFKKSGVVEEATERTWDGSGLRMVGKPDGSCLTDSRYEKNLLGWQATGAKISYYDYFMGVYPARQRYIPMADEMQAMCRRFIEKNIEGTETQIEVFNHWNNIFNFYTYGRTSYDSNLSMEDNLQRFCTIFGKGASYIADNIRHAEEVLDGQSDIMSAGISLNKMFIKIYKKE